jgi:hypothetical protein
MLQEGDIMKNKFIENYKIDYRAKGMVEKKQQFDYLSWAHAQKIMREDYPAMKWEMKWNEQNNSFNWSGFVRIEFVNGENVEVINYPILDNRNKPIGVPNQFDINNAQMRGFAKGFAMLTGHSLNLFTGEDLTQYESTEQTKTANAEKESETDKIMAELIKMPQYKKLSAENKKTLEKLDITKKMAYLTKWSDEIETIKQTKKDLEGENNE